MILGLGNDIVDIRRIEKTLERFGDRFIDRIFTDIEQLDSHNLRSYTPTESAAASHLFKSLHLEPVSTPVI